MAKRGKRCWPLMHRYGPWKMHLLSFQRRECLKCPRAQIRHILTGVAFTEDQLYGDDYPIKPH